MEIARFSPGGEYLGTSGSDGRLKIWDSATSTLKQEFVPSSHLTATCTCIEWAPDGSSSQVKEHSSKHCKIADFVFHDFGKQHLYHDS